MASKWSQLQFHIKSAHPPTCVACKKTFTRRSGLAGHYQSTGHDGGESAVESTTAKSRKQFKCKECTKCFVKVFLCLICWNILFKCMLIPVTGDSNRTFVRFATRALDTSICWWGIIDSIKKWASMIWNLACQRLQTRLIFPQVRSSSLKLLNLPAIHTICMQKRMGESTAVHWVARSVSCASMM